MADNSKSGIDKLRDYACGMKPRRCDDVLEIAAQIEAEHQSELNDMREAHGLLLHEVERKRGLTDEARGVVERLRGLDCENPKSDLHELIFGKKAPTIATARDLNEKITNRLIELLEHDSTPDVDVAAMLAIAAKIEKDANSTIFDADPDGIENYYTSLLAFYANSIHKAVEGAPKPGTVCEGETHAQDSNSCVGECSLCEQNGMAEWVEQHGGIDIVRDYPQMDEFVATLANDLGVSDDIGCGDDLREAVKDELDKRLMPPGMEWPRFEDGEKVGFGKRASINGVTVDVDEVSFVGFYGKLESRIAGLDPRVNSRLHGPYSSLGERVKRPEPEVLGADGKPIKVGETVCTVYNGEEYRVSEVHAEKSSCGSNKPWVKYADGEGWDCADKITHIPPDTQERIDEDKRKSSFDYWGCCNCADCPAKIDGEKPYDHYGVDNCAIAHGMDIARRQRDLDAKTMGGAR